MKFIKSLKKIKFWSRKKKKKKPYPLPPLRPPPPPPPLPSHLCCCSCPSAPPLPPWYDADQPYDAVPVLGLAFPTQQQQQQQQFSSQEMVSEFTPLFPPLPVTVTTPPSYQQYMVPNPVYDLPAEPAPTKEKSAGIFGCVVEIGKFLIRCFCPCFHIREVGSR